MDDFYNSNSIEYHASTFHVDPTSFLSPLSNELEKGSTILDIGCGSGRDLLWLRKKGFTPMGLERSPNLVKLARKNSYCPVIEADFLTYDFSKEQFNALILVGALVHLDHLQLAPILQSICQALKNKGFIYLTLKEGEGKQESEDGRIFTLWKQSNLEDIFAQQNLNIVDFSRQVSKIRDNDFWLGYFLQEG